MLKLNAIKSEKVWGYELWIASTHSNGCQEEFKKACGGNFPLLVKIIQANDKLSVQVHPDDDCAVKLEGKGNTGKTECWYILDAQEDSKIVYGLKKETSKEVLKKAIEENRLEDFLEYVNVKSGDFVYIPAGTVHAIGSGVRLMEVQQSCDLTYRLYDWGRGRDVHVDKALSVIKQDKMIPVKPFTGNFNCQYFDLQQVNVKGGWSMYCSGDKSNPDDVQLIYIISTNKAVIRTSEEKIGKAILKEEIYAVFPGEKVTVEGTAQIMRIRTKC